MKKHSRDLDVFIKEFRFWQNKLDLNDYQVYFKEGYLDDCYGEITTDTAQMVATVTLDVRKSDFRNIKKTAKHEAVHLLLSKLEYLARSRFATLDEIDRTTEGLVNKLVNIL